MCEQFKSSFSETNPYKIYDYLIKLGMYKPNRKSYRNFEDMKLEGVWGKVDAMFKKYRRKWKGPNIPIYIFPIGAINGLFLGRQEKKSGLAFKDKLFLFLSSLDDEKELEALFVHEYHHTCRINKQNKRIEEFTLLDSIVMEGLAENAVKECCGTKYVANWCTYYSNKEILHFWKRYIHKSLHVKKEDEIHDYILYGSKNYPRMLGYAAGFEIVSMYKMKNDFSIIQSFQLPSKHFILEMENSI